MKKTIQIDLTKEARKLLPYLVDVRRHIHAYPEAGADQPLTVAYLVQQFEGMDVQLTYGGDHVGLVVDIVGHQPGPTLGFRADTDALELSETKDPLHTPNRLGFRSTIENYMHACGHDAHTAILMGLGRLAHANRDRLKGRIRLLFQPGEEGYYGAIRMVKKGYLEEVDQVFALHCHPALHTGRIGYRSGSIMAAVDVFMGKITGVGGHGASPHTSTDQVLALCRTIENLQAIVSRRIDPLASAVVSVCYLSAGSRETKTIMPAAVEFGGTVRTLDAGVRELIKNEFPAICDASVKSIHPRCRVDLDYHYGYDETINDAGVISNITGILSACMDEPDLLTDYPPLLGSEDFSSMLTEVPGAMIFLGVTPGDVDTASVPFLHSPDFDIDETALMHGVRTFGNIAFNYP
ncbi:MAG: amidohydrolase [Desulfobacteraceae bacterium]|nr:amidohydrolase [Desulfobacteraceae bacterium]